MNVSKCLCDQCTMTVEQCRGKHSAAGSAGVLDIAIDEIEGMVLILEDAVPDTSFPPFVEDKKMTVGAYNTIITMLKALRQQGERDR